MNLEERIGYKFKNSSYLTDALTRRSYCVEHKLKEYNQRLEFLGDSVLKLLTSEILFELYPEFPEGKLSKIRSISPFWSIMNVLRIMP